MPRPKVVEYVTLKIFDHKWLPDSLGEIKRQLLRSGAIEDIWVSEYEKFVEGRRDHFFYRVGVDEYFETDVEKLMWTDAIVIMGDTSQTL